jgi:uncharacterized membrane protein YccC
LIPILAVLSYIEPMRLSLSTQMHLLARQALRQVTDPYRRYRHAKLIHATRVAIGILASIAFTTGIHLPHGEWASITLLVVIGGLQHHGNIRKKAAERALGTLIGASIGLALILLQSWLHWPVLTYLLMAIACGIGGYYAIGQGGYIALLSAITVVIVAGHGDAEISDGLWRSADVLIGIAIALLFSFALPLYATYSWRYKLSDSLRDCARLYSRIVGGLPIDDGEHQKILVRQGATLVQLRSLMPSVSKEISVPTAELETVQRNLRGIVGTLEMLSTAGLRDVNENRRQVIRQALSGEDRRIRELLIGMARALKFGTLTRLKPLPPPQPPPPSPDTVSAEVERYVWVTAQLFDQIDGLRQSLSKFSQQWNI